MDFPRAARSEKISCIINKLYYFTSLTINCYPLSLGRSLMETIKTIVADGNEIFRYGLCSILREEPFDVSSEIDNGALVLTVF